MSNLSVKGLVFRFFYLKEEKEEVLLEGKCEKSKRVFMNS